MKTRLHKSWLRLALFGVLGVATFACGGDRDRDADTLTLWTSNNPPEITTADWAVQRFRESGGKAEAQPVPEGQSSEEVILAAVVGGTTPDIYANMWQGSVALYAEAHVLVALDTLDGFLPWLTARCTPETIAEVTAPDGHIYQVPWKVNPIRMSYRVDAFPEGAPRTYDEYLAAAKRLQADQSGDGYVDTYVGYTSPRTIWYERLFNFYPLYLAATAGAPLVADGKAAFDRPEAVAVFAFLRKLYADNYFTRDRLDAQGDPFLSRKIASKWTGPWDISYLERYAPADLKYDFAAMLVPNRNTDSLPPYTYADPKNIVIFNTCPNAQEAWDFLANGMLSLEGDLQLLTRSNQLPRRADLLTNPAFSDYFRQNPRMVPFAEQARRIAGVTHEPLIIEVLDVISQEYEACVLFGMKTPEAAIHDAAEAVNVILRADNPT